MVAVVTIPLAPSLHLHSLSLSLSPPSLHLCAGDARVSFLSIRFVLTSPGRAPLTLPADDTRGGGGGRGDKEKLLSLLSRLSITLKEKREREREREREKADQTRATTKRKDTQDIHTYIKETLLFSILLFKEGIFLPFPPLSFSTPIFSSEIPVLSITAPELLWDFR